MTSNLKLDAIDLHTNGLRAAAVYDQFIAQLFASPEAAALELQKKIVDPIFQDRVWYARMYYLATGDRDTAAQMIKGYQYLQAHLFLGKHMHALVIIDNLRITNESNQPVVDLEPAYPVTEGYYRPVFASMVEVLRETCMPSHAPTAAISAATCSI
jgi:hypothetical protein